MPLNNSGTNLIASALLGDGSYSLLDNTNAALGVGDDSTVHSPSQTQLQAEANATNSLRKGMNTGFPARNPDTDGSDNLTRYQCTFGTAEANFNWLEWGVFNDVTSGGGQMLCRVVEDLGTKTNASKWVLEVDLTISS
jgi:hypothetical protein